MIVRHIYEHTARNCRGDGAVVKVEPKVENYNFVIVAPTCALCFAEYRLVHREMTALFGEDTEESPRDSYKEFDRSEPGRHSRF